MIVLEKITRKCSESHVNMRNKRNPWKNPVFMALEREREMFITNWSFRTRRLIHLQNQSSEIKGGQYTDCSKQRDVHNKLQHSKQKEIKGWWDELLFSYSHWSSIFCCSFKECLDKGLDVELLEIRIRLSAANKHDWCSRYVYHWQCCSNLHDWRIEVNSSNLSRCRIRGGSINLYFAIAGWGFGNQVGDIQEHWRRSFGIVFVFCVFDFSF